MKKLSIRLSQIFKIVSSIENKEYVYDVCCDHGHLAYHIWLSHKVKKIFAIDCATKVISQLRDRYAKITDNRFEISCDYAEEVKYLDNSTVIIAGVGAHTSISIINHLIDTQMSLVNLDIICCCHQNIDLLREYLNNSSKLGVLSEKLIEENDKFYEVIHLKKGALDKVSLVGESIWSQGEMSRKYYKNQLDYWNIRRDSKASLYQKKLKEKQEEWEL